MAIHNLTPDQAAMPKEVRREAYGNIPETCDKLRSILDEAQARIMLDLDTPPEYAATFDAAMSRAFQRIRDEISHPFRTEQMKLIYMNEEV